MSLIGNKKRRGSNNNECSICLEEINNGEPLRQLKCAHTFHKECVEQWMDIHPTCPYCRQCENNIECSWLWLKSYNLSWINKRYKYKYSLKEGYIEIMRKNFIRRINLYSIKEVHAIGHTITYNFKNGKLNPEDLKVLEDLAQDLSGQYSK